MSFPLRLIGHRGAARERPENTLPSFERALEIGVDVLETDVQMTRDGVVVVSHDDDGGRMAGVARPIRASTFDEVRSWDAGRGFRDGNGGTSFAGCGVAVPSFEEVLTRFPDAQLNVDIKPNDLRVVDAVLALLAAHRAQDRVTLASFHTRVIEAVRRKFAGPTVLAQREVLWLVATPLAVLRFTGVKGSAVQLPPHAGGVELGSTRFIDKCHSLGLRVDFWTVNDPVVADILLARGADGLISDDPARLKPLFERRRAPLRLSGRIHEG